MQHACASGVGQQGSSWQDGGKGVKGKDLRATLTTRTTQLLKSRQEQFFHNKQRGEPISDALLNGWDLHNGKQFLCSLALTIFAAHPPPLSLPFSIPPCLLVESKVKSNSE